MLNLQNLELNLQNLASLNGYIDDMTTLELQYHLSESKRGNPVRAIAAARTSTAMQGANGVLKGSLIRYLWESGLITAPQPIVNLYGINLDGSVLNNAVLTDADLSGSALFESNLIGANLHGSDLSRSLLISTGLADADLTGANLAGADLTGADLAGADLAGADLKGARYNSKPEYVTNPQGQIVIEEPTRWPRGFDPQVAGASCYNC